MAERLCVDRRDRAGRKLVDVYAEERDARLTCLQDRRPVGIARLADGDVHAAGNRLGVRGLREADLEAWRRDGRLRDDDRRRDEQVYDSTHHEVVADAEDEIGEMVRRGEPI